MRHWVAQAKEKATNYPIIEPGFISIDDGSGRHDVEDLKKALANAFEVPFDMLWVSDNYNRESTMSDFIVRSFAVDFEEEFGDLVREDKVVAQTLYASMCNTLWFHKDNRLPWSASWRASGGIVAEMRKCGENYIDWYCSGAEGNVSTLIKDHAATLGWTATEYPDGCKHEETVTYDNGEECCCKCGAYIPGHGGQNKKG